MNYKIVIAENEFFYKEIKQGKYLILSIGITSD